MNKPTFGIYASRIFVTASIVNETFVDIGASLGPNSVALVSRITLATSRSGGVRARGIRVTSAIVGQAFVDVHAAGIADAISLIPGIT